MAAPLFAVYPAPITSMNDWDRHRVGAADLMRLYGVHPRECVVFRDERDTLGWRGRRFDLMPLVPRVQGYTPVTDAERTRINAGERWWRTEDHPWADCLALASTPPGGSDA